MCQRTDDHIFETLLVPFFFQVDRLLQGKRRVENCGQILFPALLAWAAQACFTGTSKSKSLLSWPVRESSRRRESTLELNCCCCKHPPKNLPKGKWRQTKRKTVIMYTRLLGKNPALFSPPIINFHS